MIVNIEFLDEEPLENVITSLHYQIDKTIFFGYSDTIEKRKESTENFLKKYCGVSEVVFHPVSRTNLESILKTMRGVVEKERAQKNKVFFDVTGGESLILVTFGILSTELKCSMHMYDVEKQKLVELNRDIKPFMSETAPAREVALNLDSFIEMYGGVINYRLQKENKYVDDPEFEQEILKLWDISSKNPDHWNQFSNFLKGCCRQEEDKKASLKVCLSTRDVLEQLRKNNRFRTPAMLNRLLDECAKAGFLLNVVHENGRYEFTYKNERVKEYLWDAGSVLEMYTFLQERKNSDDCRVGVHLDWDGVIHNQPSLDTLNEIDVLTLNGCIPTFISCKNGNVNQMALYELETVADKFGGKYAKKVLVAPQKLTDTHLLRAKEMGIEVRS